MKYYYLLNGKIMSANEKMPDKLSYKSYHLDFEIDTKQWYNSLQPCEISESELEKIISELNNSRIIYPRKNELIEVTDMIRTEEIKTITKSGTITDYKFFFKQPSDNNGVISFKQPKQVGEIESVAGYVAFNINGIISGIYSNLEWLKEDYPKSGYYKLSTLRNI